MYKGGITWWDLPYEEAAMKERLRLCRDCMHRFGWFTDRCRVPAEPWTSINPVTGCLNHFGNDSCAAERINWHNRPDACGPDGKKWEPKI